VIISLVVIPKDEKPTGKLALTMYLLFVPVSSVVSGKAHSDIRYGKMSHRTRKKDDTRVSRIQLLYTDNRAGFTYSTCKSRICSYKWCIATDRCRDKKCIIDRDPVLA